MEAQESSRVPLPRWITPVLLLTSAGRLPWARSLEVTLPARHVHTHYDVAWVVFDCALFCVFAATAWCTVKASQWLVPLAAVTGTMLLCDAWFDVVTAIGGGDSLEALLEGG